MSASQSLGYLNSKLNQIAYVVEDFDRAAVFFKASLGIERFFVWDMITKDQTEKIYRGKPGTFEFSAAYAYSGDMQIELCKHHSGENVDKDWLATRGVGLHHTGYRLDDGDDGYGARLREDEAGRSPLRLGQANLQQQPTSRLVQRLGPHGPRRAHAEFAWGDHNLAS